MGMPLQLIILLFERIVICCCSFLSVFLIAQLQWNTLKMRLTSVDICIIFLSSLFLVTHRLNLLIEIADIEGVL